MQTYENERVIQQGEDWNLDIRLSQSIGEYIPYVISSEREHPHFVLTVASTKFEKNHRYVESWWQEIPDTQPRFYETVPFYVGEFAKNAEPTKFSDLVDKAKEEKLPTDISKDTAKYRLYQYTVTGDPEFKYCYLTDKDKGTIELGYELYVRFNILSHLPGYKGIKGGTSQWNAQEYMYAITLVSGQPLVETIADAVDNYPDLNWRSDLPRRADYIKQNKEDKYVEDLHNFINKDTVKEDLFKFIKLHIPGYFQDDIDWTSSLGRIWSPIPILKPTKLRVDSNLRVLI
jgi:hypothetical protein